MSDALKRVLIYLGYQPYEGQEIQVGGNNLGTSRVWLGIADVQRFELFDQRALLVKGFHTQDLKYLLLKTHYRDPIVLNWELLLEAKAERSELLSLSRALKGVEFEPSSRARAGYLHHFREALSKDINFPLAINCLWDAFRPGALSSGSRASLIREALPVIMGDQINARV
jgi:hypothetical protein